MGKRSDFKRVARDAYDTPFEAVAPLLPHLPARLDFNEPCAGAGVLIGHLGQAGHYCVSASDIEPRGCGIDTADARSADFHRGQMFVTNPPWSRPILHAIIENLSRQAPAWLLFDADWMHTRQAVPYLRKLRKIVSVGRIKWIPGTTMTGKDNCCWYLFDYSTGHAEKIEFIGRGLAA